MKKIAILVLFIGLIVLLGCQMTTSSVTTGESSTSSQTTPITTGTYILLMQAIRNHFQNLDYTLLDEVQVKNMKHTPYRIVEIQEEKQHELLEAVQTFIKNAVDGGFSPGFSVFEPDYVMTFLNETEIIEIEFRINETLQLNVKYFKDQDQLFGFSIYGNEFLELVQSWVSWFESSIPTL